MNFYSFEILTQAKYELVNITEKISSAIAESGIASGLAVVFVPHTTAGLVCNEDESKLKSDILRVVKSIEEKSVVFGGFAHDAREGLSADQAGNAHAHIVSALSGNSRSFIIEGGQIRLGTWQTIMFLEMDGPRTREIWVKVISD